MQRIAKERGAGVAWNKGRAVLRVIIRALAVIVSAAAVTVVVAGLAPPCTPRTAEGRSRVIARYVTMDDGVRLAVYVALPENPVGGRSGGSSVGAGIPTILETTRYGTMPSPTFMMRALGNLGVAKLGIGGVSTTRPTRLDYLRLGAYSHGVGEAMDAFLAAGYAFAMASARGSGASFGKRPMEMSREEISDSGDIIAWLATQDWSDGTVGTYGVSYSGNTAELACVSAPPALKAAAPYYADFDPVGDNIFPGGILNDRLLRDWNEGTLAADSGGDDNAFIVSAAAVDGPAGRRLRKEAYAGHETLDLYAALKRLDSLDGEMVPGYRPGDLALASYRDRIGISGIPLRVRAGWLDASTAGGAIERFLTFSNAQDVDIGPWGHGGFTWSDPFLENAAGSAATEGRTDTLKTQAQGLVEFFGRHLGADATGNISGKTMRYYTYGAGTWSATEVWPPKGARPMRFRLGPGKRLLPACADKAGSRQQEPAGGADELLIDFGASTGESNRWRTNLGGGAVVYPDRLREDEKLLYWDSEPMSCDTVMTGSPWVSVWITSSVDDGAFHVYLENVAPDGTVSYITEGLLRALHRKPIEPDPLAGALGPRHSFSAKDAEPLTPGQPAELRIAMEPISILLRAGHRVRIAVAGADASNFARIPEAGEVRVSVLYGEAHPSFLEIPIIETAPAE